MTLNNPEILYVRRYPVHGDATTWVYRGITIGVLERDGVVHAYIHVTGPENGPVGDNIPISHLIPVPRRYGPAREIRVEEADTLGRVAIAEEQYTDWWFAQQTNLAIINTYRMGYEARAAASRRGELALNPIIGGDDEQALLHVAWDNGYARHANIEMWQKERDAWRNPA